MIRALESNIKSKLKTGPNSLADIDFKLHYTSPSAMHTDSYFGRNVNFWRDFFPEKMQQGLMGREIGDAVEFTFKPGEIISPHQRHRTLDIKPDQFSRDIRNGMVVEPHCGRFYPKGVLRNIGGIFPQNTEPFRCVDIHDSYMSVDFNHPLSSRYVNLTATINSIREKNVERGGSCIDWIETIATGPGMQNRKDNRPTDFFSKHSFNRLDESPDDRFYRTPRFVNHVDDQAVEFIQKIYSGLLQSGMTVLDLMSSWVSHLTPDLRLDVVTGLGMNRYEMEANERLNHFVVHDLNRQPMLPFEAESFDAVICTVSVEYLIRPFAVFEDISRLLKPNGLFIITFSNRWFPPKVVKIWEELHDFEKMGLVLEYFLKSEKYTYLETLSIRGYPRPIYDKYFPELLLSDPVYAVWGRRK
jgi:FKBP-type peptidyl-prolyl cis-trans isomerase 2